MGKKRLAGDTACQATSTEVKDLRAESLALKEVVADLTLENRALKKTRAGLGATADVLTKCSSMSKCCAHPGWQTLREGKLSPFALSMGNVVVPP